jgi:hypothetical protein
MNEVFERVAGSHQDAGDDPGLAYHYWTRVPKSNTPMSEDILEQREGCFDSIDQTESCRTPTHRTVPL